MQRVVEPGLTIRTGMVADLPALQQVFRAASLSNADDAPMLLARPEFLVFTGDGLAGGRTFVAVADQPGEGPGEGTVVGFATIAADRDGGAPADGEDDAEGAELEDLFVDPHRRRRGIARHLVRQVAAVSLDAGRRRLRVTGNPHALGFYHAVGFVQTGPVATALGTGLRMSLDLNTV